MDEAGNTMESKNVIIPAYQLNLYFSHSIAMKND